LILQPKTINGGQHKDVTHPRILQGNGGQQKILQPKTINGGQHKDVILNTGRN